MASKFCTSSLFTLLCMLVQSIRSVHTTSVNTIHTFPLGTWIENLAIRSNGLILATSASSPQLWQIDSNNPDTADLITTIPFHTALSGITELEPDIFYIGANNFTLYPPSVHPNASAVYRIDLSQYKPPTPLTPTLVADFPVSGLLNGFTTLSQQYIFIADAGLGVIWRLDVHTGEKTAVIADPLMRVVDPQKEPIGVNGIKIRDGYLYFSNTNQELLGRVPISATGQPLGAAELVARYSAPDDFVLVGRGGDEAVVAGNNSLRVIRDGVVSIVADSPLLAGSTAVAFGARGCGKAKKAFVSTNGGVEQYGAENVTIPGRVVSVSCS
jgi:hypothetical protein